MKGSKVFCHRCGRTVVIPFVEKRSLSIPSSGIDPSPLAQAEKAKCPYCGFELEQIPYTIEEFFCLSYGGAVELICYNCGKSLENYDDILVLHTHEDAKPAEYELEASLAPDKLYRKVKEAEPEKEHRYFF